MSSFSVRPVQDGHQVVQHLRPHPGPAYPHLQEVPAQRAALLWDQAGGQPAGTRDGVPGTGKTM